MIVGIRIPKRVRLYLSVFGTKVGTEQKMGGGMLRKFGMDMYTLSYLKWVTSKDLPCSAGDSAQCYVSTLMGGGLSENGYLCTCGWVPLLST